MIIDRINPPGLEEIPGAVHVTVATGSRIVHISGQTGTDETGEPVGPGYGEQTARALRNLRTACQAVGAGLTDIAKFTIYVVDYTPEAFEQIVGAAITEAPEDYPSTASTLVGVSALFNPGLLIEIDAVLVLD